MPDINTIILNKLVVRFVFNPPLISHFTMTSENRSRFSRCYFFSEEISPVYEAMKEDITNYAEWFLIDDLESECLKKYINNIFRQTEHYTIIILFAKDGNVCIATKNGEGHSKYVLKILGEENEDITPTSPVNFVVYGKHEINFILLSKRTLQSNFIDCLDVAKQTNLDIESQLKSAYEQFARNDQAENFEFFSFH